MVNRFARIFQIAALTLTVLAVSACSSGDVSQREYDALQDDLGAAQSSLTVVGNERAAAQTGLNEADSRAAALGTQVGALQAQIAATGPSIIVQTVVDAPTGGATLSGWDTDASLAANVQLLATYDSSGDAAWDAAAHTDVFVTSEGSGYAGYYSDTYKVAGLQIIDAVTKEHVASAGFDLGYANMGTPHGLGVSPDGRWIYVPTSDGKQPWQMNAPDGGRLLVVDAKTLKLNQVIGTNKGPHHIKSFTDSNGNDRIIVETQGAATLLFDPNDDNRVVFEIGPAKLYGQAYQVDADPAGENLYIDLVLGSRGIASEIEGVVAKVSLATGRVTYIPNIGMYPNGFAFTADGKFTYVADSSGDRVYKIDNATNKAVGSTQTGVAGPYMIELNLDETELWVVGKGEMTYNLGGPLSVIDTKTFRAVRDYYIGGQTIDHNLVNPADPTERWVTSSGTAEVIVFDLTSRTVKARIADQNGGDTHSGAFVHYEPDFSGEMRNDNSGARGAYFVDKLAAIEAAK
jgi:DNA-binding beta-propeller fold protein YncE